jgi:hypothetical protein
MSAIAVPIIEARFETKDGVLLAAYTAEQLESGSKKEDAA